MVAKDLELYLGIKHPAIKVAVLPFEGYQTTQFGLPDQACRQIHRSTPTRLLRRGQFKNCLVEDGLPGSGKKRQRGRVAIDHGIFAQHDDRIWAGLEETEIAILLPLQLSIFDVDGGEKGVELPGQPAKFVIGKHRQWGVAELPGIAIELGDHRRHRAAQAATEQIAGQCR